MWVPHAAPLLLRVAQASDGAPGGGVDGLIGLALSFGVVGSGLFLVARLVIGFQRDFTERYAARLRAQDAKIEEQGARITLLERRLMLAEGERQALRATMARNGMPWDSSAWEVGADGYG